MQTLMAPRGNARTFLAHFVAGLDEDLDAHQQFRSMANGDIVAVHAERTKRKDRRKLWPTIVSLKAVEKMRPARHEIIVATGSKLRGSGVQLWGWRATGIFTDRRKKG